MHSAVEVQLSVCFYLWEFSSPSSSIQLFSKDKALFLKKIEVQLIYNVVLITAVQQSDSVIHCFFNILFHYGLS